MRITIRGTVFDTDTADRIGQARYGDDMHDPSYWQATLYRTPQSKKHFLAGVGGSMSIFRQRKGRSRLRNGVKSNPAGMPLVVIPVSEAEALEWLCAYAKREE